MFIANLMWGSCGSTRVAWVVNLEVSSLIPVSATR